MTSTEMRERLAELGWTAGELGRRTGISARTVADWLTGRRPIPQPIASWLDQVAEHMAKAPPPPRRPE